MANKKSKKYVNFSKTMPEREAVPKERKPPSIYIMVMDSFGSSHAKRFAGQVGIHKYETKIMKSDSTL